MRSWIRRWQSSRRLDKAIRRLNKHLKSKKPPYWIGMNATIEVLSVRPSQMEAAPWTGKPEFVGRVKRSDGKNGLFAFTHGGEPGAPFEVAGAAISFARYG